MSNTEKDKAWFIAEYSEIHENLEQLEADIIMYVDNKSADASILENLKEKTLKEIKRLEKTREHERKRFNY